jgi:hypothetical protein
VDHTPDYDRLRSREKRLSTGFRQIPAKRRLADEYDAAQERGEVAAHGGERGNQHVANVPAGNVATVADLGLTRKATDKTRQL